jgi:hypothetical protein
MLAALDVRLQPPRFFAYLLTLLTESIAFVIEWQRRA